MTCSLFEFLARTIVAAIVLQIIPQCSDPAEIYRARYKIKSIQSTDYFEGKKISMSFQYNAMGLLARTDHSVTILDPVNPRETTTTTTLYEYDQKGNVAMQKRISGAAVYEDRYIYEGNKLKWILDSEGDTIIYSYDSDRAISRIRHDTTVTTKYYSGGQLDSVYFVAGKYIIGKQFYVYGGRPNHSEIPLAMGAGLVNPCREILEIQTRQIGGVTTRKFKNHYDSRGRQVRTDRIFCNTEAITTYSYAE